MRAPFPLLLVVSAGMIALPARAEVEGVVHSRAGIPIEHARVAAGDVAIDFTDDDGRFVLPAVWPPVILEVSHPKYVSARVELAGESPAHVEVVLEAKQEIYEEIVVSASRGEENFAPVSVAASTIEPVEATMTAATLTELVTAVPSVSENGQGGIFQTYSIRGVSRQRVMTLVSGMRIVGERRAGVSASFVDPRLMGAVDVVRGPASSYYGSGALGGVVQLFARRFDGAAAELGYQSQGEETAALVGWGASGWSLGLAHRQAEDAETPDGERLHSAFRQTSATLRRDWQAGNLDFGLEVVAAAGRDIGKAATDFPERVTDYPEEHHGLFKFEVRAASGWSLEAWVHPNDLLTRVEDVGESVSTVDNEAFDLGLNWQKRLRDGAALPLVVGVEYFGRRDVTSRETVQPVAGADVPAELVTLDGAEEDELGLYAAAEWNWGNVKWVAGGRATLHGQSNGGESRDDEALTVFAGAVAPLGGGFELSGNVGTGLRFPSLSERFFTGTTGRGGVVGNPDLDPESSINSDIGLRWFGSRLFVGGYAFYNRIDDYIERIEVEPDVLTFVNLSSGYIAGLEAEGSFQVSAAARIDFGGQTIQGKDDADHPLADIPADRLFAGGQLRRGRWWLEGRFEHRFDKTDPASGEKKIPDANLLRLALAYEFSDRLRLILDTRNLLDEQYFNSADDKVPLAPGRSVGISLRWSQSS